jgi:hypothetical protein
VEHLRYARGALVAIHDWDSLVVRPEAALAGAISGAFTIDWTQIERCGVPTPQESEAFLRDYERARGVAFSTPERALARAALLYQTAYSARCEWSDLGAPSGVPPGGHLAQLVALTA